MENHAASGGDLARLIEAEQRLEESLARARADATALVDAARAEAVTAELALERELQAAEARLAAEIQAESTRRVAEVDADGQRAAAVTDAVSEDHVAELSSGVVRSLVGGVENP